MVLIRSNSLFTLIIDVKSKYKDWKSSKKLSCFKLQVLKTIFYKNFWKMLWSLEDGLVLILGSRLFIDLLLLSRGVRWNGFGLFWNVTLPVMCKLDTKFLRNLFASLDFESSNDYKLMNSSYLNKVLITFDSVFNSHFIEEIHYRLDNCPRCFWVCSSILKRLIRLKLFCNELIRNVIHNQRPCVWGWRFLCFAFFLVIK